MWAKGGQKRRCSALPSGQLVVRNQLRLNGLRRFQNHADRGKGRSAATHSIRCPRVVAHRTKGRSLRVVARDDSKLLLAPSGSNRKTPGGLFAVVAGER